MEAELDRTGRGRYGNLEYMEENCDLFLVLLDIICQFSDMNITRYINMHVLEISIVLQV